MQDNQTGSPVTQLPPGEDSLSGLLERLRREPSLRSWVLAAPTGALAKMGVTLDDHEITDLLDQIEKMDAGPLPVTARDIMTPDPFTVTPETSMHDAAALLFEKRISGVPVCDDGGNLVGVLSEFDLIARTGRTVAELMTRDVVSVPEMATVGAIRALFVSRRLKRVPVVGADGRLVGLISRADLVREVAFRWTCRRCGQMVRARRAPDGCDRCGAAGSLEPAPLEPVLQSCPTCGRPLEK